MALIKLLVDGTELDVVRETLSIRKDNDALNRDFTVNRNSHPFLIVENETTKRLLGTRDLTSVGKIKTIIVQVSEAGMNYYGELQILSYINGFRKCNLKYATALLSIMQQKISDFMPVVSVIPDEDSPEPFVDKSDVPFEGAENWETYPLSFLDKNFPAVKWQFPTMKWENKYGTDLTEDDPWYLFRGFINRYNSELTALIENEYTDIGGGAFDIFNRNVVSPQVFLLSPLFYALQSIGYKFSGSFPSSEFVKRILMLSTKDNLTEVSLKGDPVVIDFSESSWIDSPSFPIAGYPNHYKAVGVTLATPGNYTVKYRFELRGHGPATYYPYMCALLANPMGEGDTFIFVKSIVNPDHLIVEGSTDIIVAEAGVMSFRFYSSFEEMPYSYDLSVVLNEEQIYQEMHPTIQTGRFVPDWTFAEYIRNLKNFFNLEVTIDDLSKTMVLDFNEAKFIAGLKTILPRSFALVSYDPSPTTAFHLKYENDEDASLWITASGPEAFVSQKSDFSEDLDCKFKLVPNVATAELSDELEEKDGVGLMIYDPVNMPFTSESFEGQTLLIAGEGGIYETNWRVWLKFRLNASSLEMSGSLSQRELSELSKLKRVYLDNQEYIVGTLDYSETEQGNYLVKLQLLSVNL